MKGSQTWWVGVERGSSAQQEQCTQRLCFGDSFRLVLQTEWQCGFNFINDRLVAQGEVTVVSRSHSLQGFTGQGKELRFSSSNSENSMEGFKQKTTGLSYDLIYI